MKSRVSSFSVFGSDVVFGYLLDFSVYSDIVFVCSLSVGVAVLDVGGGFNRRGTVA